MSTHSVPQCFVPIRELPPYSYVSGKFPHPTGDPNGHSFGVSGQRFTIGSEDECRTCESYLWGIDLFNHGFYWEAHEAWEAVWHAAGRKGLIADFCKALIKFAAAGVKAREGRPEGVQRHARRAKQLLQSVAAECDRENQRFMGLSLNALATYADELIRNPEEIIDTGDELVVVVMPFVLQVAKNE